MEELDCFSCAKDLVQFMGACDTPFELTEIEADKLLGYMSGHDFLLGEKEGKLFRGDLCYQQEKIRWTEDAIDDVINDVSKWNYDLLKQAQAEMGSPNDFIDFANKKAKKDSLGEDYQILDVLFDRTTYGVEIEALAKTLADELIQNLKSKEGIDGAIQRMTETIAEGQDLLPEVSPELKQRSGRVR